MTLPSSGLSEATRQTSEAAADAVHDAATERARVYHVIVRAGPRGATDDEIQVVLDMHGNTERPRRIELWRAGLVVQARTEAGVVIKRPTRSGRLAVAWVCAGEAVRHG